MQLSTDVGHFTVLHPAPSTLCHVGASLLGPSGLAVAGPAWKVLRPPWLCGGFAGWSQALCPQTRPSW